MNTLLLEMNVSLYMHVLTQSHVNAPIEALDNVLCLCIFLIRERGHASTRMTIRDRKKYKNRNSDSIRFDSLHIRLDSIRLTF